MKLYVIGNGFDISHNIQCRYSDFYNYLKEYRSDILETMEKYYYVEHDSDLWSDFENSLEKNINYDSLSEIIAENTPNLASDDFRDRDWYDAQIYVEQECDELLGDVRSGFEEWIESLKVSEAKKKYKLDRSAYYLTFNYTDLLEQKYKISVSKILHIHNKTGEELIFGHGKKLEDFKVKEALYGNEKAFLSLDEYGDIESNEIGHESFAEDAVCVFFDKMRKHTTEIIQNHSSFFSNLTEIDEVIILGHSYNQIDSPYFKKMAESINVNAKWFLCYFSDNDKKAAKKIMEEILIRDNLLAYIHCDDLLIEDTQLKLF